MARARERGCARIELDVDEANHAALTLYRDLGFSAEIKAEKRSLMMGRRLEGDLKTLTPAAGRGPPRARRHARDPARHRPAAGLHGRARRARRLDRAAHLRRPAAGVVGGVQASRRPLPLGLLRAGRARASRQRRQHQLRPRRLSPLRAAARTAEAAGDGNRCRAGRRQRLVQPLPACRRHPPRARPRRLRPRAAARGRGLPQLPAHPRHRARAPARDPRRRDRHPGRVRGAAVRAARARARSHRRGDRDARAALRPRRLDPSDRDRHDPLGDRRPPGREATAATTASIRRCSPTGSWRCTKRER